MINKLTWIIITEKNCEMKQVKGKSDIMGLEKENFLLFPANSIFQSFSLDTCQ